MKRVAAVLLCAVLACAGAAPALGQSVSGGGTGGASISVTVPEYHTITVTAEHAVVSLADQSGQTEPGDQAGQSGQTDQGSQPGQAEQSVTVLTVERLSEPRLRIRPEEGFRVTWVTLNGQDVTEELADGFYTLAPVYEDLSLTVETEAADPGEEPGGDEGPEGPGGDDSGSENPGSGDSGQGDDQGNHDISGTITDEDGNPVPDATVDIGGHTGVTDEDGNFTVEDVPEGRHPVTVTDPDGGTIGRTEMEIESGEPGVTHSPDGGYILTVPDGSGLHLDMTVTEDGLLVVEGWAEVHPEKPDQGSQSGDGGPKTGDDSLLGLWAALGLAAAAAGLFSVWGKTQKARKYVRECMKIF